MTAVDADEFLRPLALEAQETLLQNEAQQTISAARKGDIGALQALSSCPGAVPIHLVGDACEVLCFHLRQGVPSIDAYQGVSEQEKLALVSVAGLGHLLRSFSGEQLENSVQRSWRAIARWLLLFQGKYVRRYPQNSHHLAVAIAVLLESVSSFKRIREQICSDLKMLKLIVQLWSDDKSSGDDCGFASKCFAVYSGESSNAKDTLLTLMLAENHGVPDIPALRILQRVRDASYGFPEDVDLLDSYASAMLAFCSEPGEPATHVQIAIAINEGIRDIIVMLNKRLISALPPPDSEVYALACSTISKFVTFIICSLEHSHSSIWVGEALKGGFLDALINLSPSLDKEPLRTSFCTTVASLLTQTLPRFFMTRSILDIFVRVTERASTREAQGQIMSSPVAKEWGLFEKFLLERAAYKSFFDRNIDRQATPTPCGNPDCEKVTTKNDFKKCAACQNVCYCSRECQVIGWKYKGHKLACKEKKDTQEEKQDEEFALYCARRDVLRHFPGIKELAERRLPGVPFAVVGVGIDYTTLPPTFEVFRLETLLEELTIHRDTVSANRAFTILMQTREGRSDKLFTRIVQSKSKDKTMTTHIEISTANAEAFNVALPSDDWKSKRLVGQDDNQNPLTVVDYDKVDAFLHKTQANIAPDS